MPTSPTSPLPPASPLLPESPVLPDSPALSAPALLPAASASAEPATPRPDLRLVPAVERAVRLIDLLAGSHEPQTLAGLARSLELPRSSVHGLLATLCALGLARRDDTDGAFTLGPRPLAWADAFSRQSDLLRVFEQQARRAGALAAETIMLAVLDGADVTYLACRTGTRPLAVNFQVGGRFPASCTSSGKAILSTMSEEDVRARIAQGGLRRLTRHSVTSVGALLAQLREARRLGHATDDEETAEGMHCFGAPVFTARQPASVAVAAVAVSVIKAGLVAKRQAQVEEAIRALGRDISAALGA